MAALVQSRGCCLAAPPCPLSAAQKRGGQAVVGVTTGQLFCAMVGSRRRLEYTVFGDAINLVSRALADRGCTAI